MNNRRKHLTFMMELWNSFNKLVGTKLVTENIVKLSPSGSKAARGGRYNIETGAWKKIRILHHIVTRSEALYDEI